MVLGPLWDAVTPGREALSKAGTKQFLLQLTLSSVRKGPPRFALARAGHLPEPRNGAPGISALLGGGSSATGEAGGRSWWSWVCPAASAWGGLLRGSRCLSRALYPGGKSVSPGRPGWQDPLQTSVGRSACVRRCIKSFTHGDRMNGRLTSVETGYFYPFCGGEDMVTEKA